MHLKYLLREWLGKLIHLAGLPGFIQECQYGSPEIGIEIEVSISEAYTIINVNGLGIYFDRATGKIDGIGGGFGPLDHE